MESKIFEQIATRYFNDTFSIYGNPPLEFHTKHTRAVSPKSVFVKIQSCSTPIELSWIQNAVVIWLSHVNEWERTAAIIACAS